jgi:small subunit ribosomal protein S11
LIWQKKQLQQRREMLKLMQTDNYMFIHHFNNIIVSLANSEGQIISWSSAGKMGFRGSKKNTPYAAQMAAQDCAKSSI